MGLAGVSASHPLLLHSHFYGFRSVMIRCLIVLVARASLHESISPPKPLGACDLQSGQSRFRSVLKCQRTTELLSDFCVTSTSILHGMYRVKGVDHLSCHFPAACVRRTSGLDNIRGDKIRGDKRTTLASGDSPEVHVVVMVGR